MSLLVVIVLLTYGALKFSQMLSKHNPFISEITERNFFDYETSLDLNEIKFKMAFSIEGYLDNEIRDDHRYVKYIVRTFGKRKDVKYQEMIPFHKCTEEDWHKFFKPANGVEDQISLIRNNPKRGMYCLDDYENYLIYGNEKNSEY